VRAASLKKGTKGQRALEGRADWTSGKLLKCRRERMHAAVEERGVERKGLLLGGLEHRVDTGEGVRISRRLNRGLLLTRGGDLQS